MKKQNLKKLKVKKLVISNIENLNKINGGGTVDSLNIPCEEADTFNTNCPFLSRQGSNCWC